ncbi:MAG TPA: MBL fold metallo-hydrolase [Nocardioides sp.]|uniref:MBL fold metallo-hydrolase n=1 Tax=Nocardioides sp. TaxID=35761 RepID=UPI002E321FD6|nr:MBL fold metallo-hydrolase [Nocardioides sp.]HEX3933006.1 MBL fold metallo-hydrolase [Nocardioides sp.]
MRITKLGHSCVRLEYDETVVVLDPGMFTDPEAVDGADAVVITHEHPDHYVCDHLARTDAPIFTIEAVAARIRQDAPEVGERVTTVSPGERFDPGIPAEAVGELHAVIHPDLPRFYNSGYVFDLGGTTVYHPGDALTVPGQRVDVLCVPVCAPWMRGAEGIDFARAVGAPYNLAIHDRIYSEAGLTIIDGHYGLLLPDTSSYHRIPDGADLDLDPV